MKIDNTAQEKRKKKKQQTQLEQMIFSVIQSCIKATVDEAMKEKFKELKYRKIFWNASIYTSPKNFA